MTPVLHQTSTTPYCSDTIELVEGVRLLGERDDLLHGLAVSAALQEQGLVSVEHTLHVVQEALLAEKAVELMEIDW